MYSYEKRMATIKHLEENQFKYTTTIYELGYPKSTPALRNWYKEYRTNKEIHHGDETQRKYTKEQRAAAIKFYLENGRQITETVKAMGYTRNDVLICICILIRRNMQMTERYSEESWMV